MSLRWTWSISHWRSTSSNRGWFSDSCINNGLLNSYFLTESLERILSFKFLKLNRCVLVQEFVNWKITSSNTDLDIVVFDFNCYSLGTKLIDTLWLSHEHDLELGSLWVIVDELSQLLVNRVFLNWNINSNSLFQVNNVLFKGLNFRFCILQLLQKL